MGNIAQMKENGTDAEIKAGEPTPKVLSLKTVLFSYASPISAAIFFERQASLYGWRTV